MLRWIPILIVLVSATTLPAQSLKVCFIGNEAFQITDEKTTLLSDFPYQSGAFGYMKYSWESVQPKGEVVALITHRHADHFDLALLNKTKWHVVAPADAASKVPADRLIPLSDHAEFRGIRIDAIPTPHASVDHNSYLVTWHGKKLYFAGDTESTSELLAQRDLDIAFVTPWLIESILSKKAEIDAQSWIVYHHTAADQDRLSKCKKCKVPAQGECFILE